MFKECIKRFKTKSARRGKEKEEIKSASEGVTGVAVVEGLERKEKTTTMRRDSASGKHEAFRRRAVRLAAHFSSRAALIMIQIRLPHSLPQACPPFCKKLPTYKAEICGGVAPPLR